MKKISSIWRKIRLNWRMFLIIMGIFSIIVALGMMLFTKSEGFDNGRIEFSQNDFNEGKLVELNGKWEFYWDRLLLPEDFLATKKPQMDALINVPSSWGDKNNEVAAFPRHGVATYRVVIKCPENLKDPALSIKTVATAYKVYANGQLVAEVGKVSSKRSDFREGAKPIIVDLPKDQQEIELIFQIANLNYANGGLRESPVFGSKQILIQQRMVLLALQLIFIGGTLIFGVYYLLLFISQPKNRAALMFSIFCFIAGTRSFIWGELPITIFFPNISYNSLANINYVTGCNLIPFLVLFVVSIFPLEYRKISLGLVLLPTLFFEALLLAPTPFMSLFINYLYLLILIQMIYVISILINAVLRKRDNAMLMFIAMCVYFLTINQDILHYKGLGGMNVSYMFLYGGLGFIVAMSYAQVKLQANIEKKLILHNENLMEADRLKDKIMATELSFLQAQIKPHFLYNALDAIADVCEEDGEKASELIVDLSIYLRGSLEFNGLDKMGRLEKELEFASTYFNIERARFGEKIQLVEALSLPKDLLIPVLILQPLVENAVRHGISKEPFGGTVVIRGELMQDGINIEIEDDGVGIEAETLALLLSKERIDQGVGLLNIHNRLMRLYGKGLEIRSEVGKGTCVKIVIPLEGKKYD